MSEFFDSASVFLCSGLVLSLVELMPFPWRSVLLESIRFSSSTSLVFEEFTFRTGFASLLFLPFAPCPQINCVPPAASVMYVPTCLKVRLILSPLKASSSGDFSAGRRLSARIEWRNLAFVFVERMKREECGSGTRCASRGGGGIDEDCGWGEDRGEMERGSESGCDFLDFVRSIIVRFAPSERLTIDEPRTISRVLSECSDILSSLLR